MFVFNIKKWNTIVYIIAFHFFCVEDILPNINQKIYIITYISYWTFQDFVFF
jgi:hypothetical protein